MADLAVRLQPRAKRDEVVGLRGEQVVIRVNAPPVDGKANAALIAFVAKRAKVAKSSVSIVKGHTSRDKVVRVDGIAERELRGALGLPGSGQPNHAVISTLNEDGSIHSAVVWVSAEGDSVAVNSAAGRKWPSNLDRNPTASVVIYDQARSG